MTARQTHLQRSAATRAKLISAATASLIEQGYAATTAVEVCRRAGVTRGAFNHHYLRLSDLFAEVLDEVYARFAPAGDENDDERGSESGDAARDTLEYRLERGLEVYTMPEFKAILELWLACRNDRQLGKALFARVAKPHFEEHARATWNRAFPEMECIAATVGDHAHVGRRILDMRLDRQHIAKLGDWIDLKSFGVSHDHSLEPLPVTKLDRGRVPQVRLDTEHLLRVIDRIPNADILRATLRRRF